MLVSQCYFYLKKITYLIYVPFSLVISSIKIFLSKFRAKISSFSAIGLCAGIVAFIIFLQYDPDAIFIMHLVTRGAYFACFAY